MNDINNLISGVHKKINGDTNSRYEGDVNTLPESYAEPASIQFINGTQEHINIYADDIPTLPIKKQDSITEWVLYIRSNLSFLNDYEKLAARISLLSEDAEFNDNVSIDSKSLATFLMFLNSNKIDVKPSIGLNNKGYIDALWQQSRDLLVEIIFTPGHESQLVTFSPDLEDPEVINKRAATLPINDIARVICSRNLNSLLCQKKTLNAVV